MFLSMYDILKRYFLSGVLVVVPVIFTFIVIRFLFQSIDGILQPVLFELLGYFIPGLGVVTTALLILLAGILSRNYFGRILYRFGDNFLARMPITRPIYSAAKQLIEAIASDKSEVFQETGLVEYPRKGVYALCFISHRFKLTKGGKTRDMVSVFVPSTPTPVSGMVIIVPPEEVILLDMTMEEGIKFLVSGGVASPDVLNEVRSKTEATIEENTDEAG